MPKILLKIVLLLIAGNLIACYRYVDSDAIINDEDDDDSLRYYENNRKLIDYFDEPIYTTGQKYHVQKERLKKHPKRPSFLNTFNPDDDQILLEALLKEMLKAEIDSQTDKVENVNSEYEQGLIKQEPLIAQSENGILVDMLPSKNETSTETNQEKDNLKSQSASLLQVSNKKLNSDHITSVELNKVKQDYFLLYVLIATCTIAAVLAVVAAGYCWITVRRKEKKFDFETNQSLSKTNILSGSNNSGDRKLAQSAQMYHYQHQKQQMLAMEKASKSIDSSDDSDEEEEEGDYTVYECPGLAPTGEMEVKNPLFKEDLKTNKQPQCSSLIETTINEESTNQILPSNSPNVPNTKSSDSMNASILTTATVPMPKND